MIEIYSKFYFLIMPVTVMLPSGKSQRFQDGNTLLACTYETSLKPYIYEYIYIYIYQFFSRKSILKPHSRQKYGKKPWKITNLGFFLIESYDWDNHCLELPSWKISYFYLVFMVLFTIPALQFIISNFTFRVSARSWKTLIKMLEINFSVAVGRWTDEC